MTRQEIEKITNDFLIEEIEIDADVLKPEALLKDELGVDSLDFVDIVVIVERNFGFKIKAEEMANVNTLGSFYDYIENKLKELGK
jgi:acyl carrier protein